MALSPKQTIFAHEYVINFNATQAAVRAGHSPRTADNQGYRLLRNADVAALVEELKAERLKKLEVTEDNVLRELARIAFSEMRTYVEWSDGKVKDSADLTLDDLAAVAEISETANGTKVKLHNKSGALELLGRHLRLFPTGIDVNQGAGDEEPPKSLTDLYRELHGAARPEPDPKKPH